MQKIIQIIKDDKGNISSIRIVMVITILFFFANWIYSVITSGEFKPSWELITFVVFMVTGKVIQKFGEGRINEVD